jgi:uncharacterized membrane protein
MTFKLKDQSSLTMQAIPGTANRIDTIDFLRGLVMIIMAIDHVRDYFHFDSFLNSPTDLAHTTGPLFATRWITHICAPTFILLSGTSAYLMGKKKTRHEVSLFLFTRGIWLILVQLTIVRFGWNFDPLFRYNSLSIISVIGCCMLVLSALIHLPLKVILSIGLLFVIGHNALDSISFEEGTVMEVVWSLLHVCKTYDLGNGYTFAIKYPIIPWTGVMALGYCLGQFFDKGYSPEKRKRNLVIIGSVCLLMFFVLRFLNVYGDPEPWSTQDTFTRTIISFFNVQKYPPSRLYLGATLGIAFVLLGKMEDWNLKRFTWITLFGNVAFFYYVMHIYLIHVLATIAVVAMGYDWHSMIYAGAPANGTPELRGSFGFSLGMMYLVWMLVVALLYPLCVRWSKFKTAYKGKWWVSYV